MFNISTKDDLPYSSNIFFNNTCYTLSFGHLFEGNLNSHQSYDQPLSSTCNLFHHISPMNHIQFQQDEKIAKAMKIIRMSIKDTKRKQYDYYSIPSVPYCSNSMMTNCNQNERTDKIQMKF